MVVVVWVWKCYGRGEMVTLRCGDGGGVWCESEGVIKEGRYHL